MTDYEKIVGIDLEEIQNGTALYCIYESEDGGNEWMPIMESTDITSLLKYAKAHYGDSTPLVMQPHIQDIMLSQIVQDAQLKKKEAAIKELLKAKGMEGKGRGVSNWFGLIWKLFKRK